MRHDKLIFVLVIVALLWWHFNGSVPTLVPPSPQATSAVFIYEKDQHPIPAGVLAGIDKLNRKGIVATTFDEDVTDGGGQVPDQYRAALEASKLTGLPCLVVSADGKVVKVVKNPTSEQAVLEAVDK